MEHEPDTKDVPMEDVEALLPPKAESDGWKSPDAIAASAASLERWAKENVHPLTGAPMDTAPAGNKMAIKVCSACQGNHADLDIHEYQTPQRPWTHWYLCPTLGDPCPISLAQMKNSEGMELDGTICQLLAAAQVGGRYLVAVCYVDRDNMLQMSLSQKSIPLGDIGKIQAWFKDACRELRGGVPQPEVMAEASRPAPLMNLYGDGNTPLS